MKSTLSRVALIGAVILVVAVGLIIALGLIQAAVVAGFSLKGCLFVAGAMVFVLMDLGVLSYIMGVILAAQLFIGLFTGLFDK